MERQTINPEILIVREGTILFFDPLGMLELTCEEHPSVLPLSHPDLIRHIIKKLRDSGCLLLTPTSQTSQLLLEKSGRPHIPTHNLDLPSANFTYQSISEATRITIEVAEGLPVGGIISPGILIDLVKSLTFRESALFKEAIMIQMEALLKGGINYFFLQGFRDGEFLKQFIASEYIFNTPIAFTLSFNAIDRIPHVVRNLTETTPVIAAGVEIDLNLFECLDIERIEDSAARLNVIGIPMIIRLNLKYKLDKGIITPAFTQTQVQKIVDTLAQCGVRIIGFGHGTTLSFAEKLHKPEISADTSRTPARVEKGQVPEHVPA